MQALSSNSFRVLLSGGLKVSGIVSLLAVFCCLPAHTAGQPGEGAALLAEANRLAARNSYPEADKLYQQFLASQPNNAMAHHMYGRMLAWEKKYEEALKEYRLSLKAKSGDASVLNDVGVTLAVSGFQPLGARFLHQACMVDKNYPGALNNLGFVLSSLDAFKQARDAFGRSLEIQPRNAKIKELKQKAESRIAEAKEFDYGAPVTWQDVPESLKKMQAIQVTKEIEKETLPESKVKVAAKVPEAKPMGDADKQWLEKAQPLFLELKTSGFASACFAGNGIVQVGDKSDSADNIGQLEISELPKVEMMGDVTVDLTGQGELELGKAKVVAKGEDCIFSVNSETGELSCYAGEFKVSNWSTVTATRTSSKVDVVAEGCQAVYAQDDSKIEARDCDEVTLVGHAQGVINSCKKVVVNDDSRAIAKNCGELTALANARVKESGCSHLEKLDHAKIESEGK